MMHALVNTVIAVLFLCCSILNFSLFRISSTKRKKYFALAQSIVTFALAIVTLFKF